MGLDFGIQFDDQGNPIPGSGQSDSDIDTESDDGADEFEAAVQ
jgi:hypothetical protein